MSAFVPAAPPVLNPRSAARVVTLTLNPALDTVTGIDHVVADHKMRCGPTQIHPGGGGINVARVLHRLGIEVCSVHLAGGLTGQRLNGLLAEEGVPMQAIETVAETRTALAVRETSSGRDFRFTLPMAGVQQDEWRAAVAATQALAQDAAYLVLSGSVPDGVPMTVYADVAQWARVQGVRVVLDTSGPALLPALEAGVYAFKPSWRELCSLVGRSLDNCDHWRDAARDLIARGMAEWVAVSLGEQGADVVTADAAWRAQALAVDAQTTVGAGDSFVAGLVWAWAQDAPMPDAVRAAVAASAAALLSPGTALCQPADVMRLLPQVVLSDGAGPVAQVR